MVLLDDLMAHPGLVIHAVHVPFRHDFHQIKVAGVVFGQQNQVIVPLLLQPVVPLGHIHLAADDGLHVGVFLGVFEELLHPVHVAVVGDGQGRHAQLVGPVEKLSYGRKSVQDGVLGMDMKVHKTHRNKGNVFPLSAQIKLSTFPSLQGDNGGHAGHQVRMGLKHSLQMHHPAFFHLGTDYRAFHRAGEDAVTVLHGDKGDGLSRRDRVSAADEHRAHHAPVGQGNVRCPLQGEHDAVIINLVGNAAQKTPYEKGGQQ